MIALLELTLIKQRWVIISMPDLSFVLNRSNSADQRLKMSIAQMMTKSSFMFPSQFDLGVMANWPVSTEIFSEFLDLPLS